MRIVLDLRLFRVSLDHDGTTVTLSNGDSADEPLFHRDMIVPAEHAPALCAFVGKPCRIVLEFDEPEAPPSASSYENQSRDFVRHSVPTDSEPYMHGVGWTDKDGIAHHVRKDWTIGPPIQSKNDPAVNPLDDGWRLLTLGLESMGYTRLPFSGQCSPAFQLVTTHSGRTTVKTVHPTDDNALAFLERGSAVINELPTIQGVVGDP